MKKILFLIAIYLLMTPQISKAQMTDTLGAMAIQGTMSVGGYQAVNRGQQAFNRMRFQQDLSTLVAEMQMMFMGNYSGINKSVISSPIFQGLDWDLGSDNGNSFYVELKNLDGATCFICKSPQWQASQIVVNNNSDCQSSGNTVKMYFK